MKDKQTGIYNIDIFRRHIADIIHRLLNAGICVQIGSELDTFRFAPRHDTQSGFITGEVFRPIESHVFKEVCQAALLRLFENGTYFLCNVELCTLLWKCIVPDVISKSVVQLSDTDILVHRQLLHGLCKYGQEIAAYNKYRNE